MKRSSTLFFACLILVLQACSQAPGFVPKNPYPGGGRDDAAAFVIGNKAYMGTGLKTGWINSTDFYAYEPATDTWQPVADLPGAPRQYASVFSLNGFGYLTCGIGVGNARYRDTWKYDPGSNVWSPSADFPDTAREGMQTAVYGNNAYLFFGQKVTGTFFKQVWKFDGNTWTQLPDFPSSPRYLSAHAQTDSVVYFVSGLDSADTLTPEVWKFNLANETWTRLPDFPGLPRWHARGVAFNNKLYFGTGWNSVFLNDFWAFDPQTETWEQALPIPALGRKGVCTFNVQDRAYVALGVDLHGTRIDEVWELVENVGLDKEKTSPGFTLFPNPAQNTLYVGDFETFDAPSFSYTVLDVTGRTVLQGQAQTWQTPMDISGLKNGTYILVLSAGKRMAAERFSVLR